MLNKAVYGILLAVAVAGTMAMTGCDSPALKAEHKKFTESDRKDFDRQKLDIMYQVAEQQYKVGDYAKCRESLRSALAVPTPYAPTHLLAARVELEGGNLDTAASELKKTIAIDGTKAEALYLLGVVYQRWQKFETACDYYQQASEKAPGEALYVLAVAEMMITQGELEKARQLLEEKSVYFEQSASMRIALARIAELQGDKALAARMYRDATLLLPEDKNLRWTYASALFDAGKYSDAARILEDLRRDPPTLPKASTSLTKGAPADTEADVEAATVTKVSLLMTLGECYLSLKRPVDARDCFQEIIRTQPDNVSAYLALGKTCLMTNDLATTTAAAQKALRFEPDNVQAMVLQAAVLQKQEKWTESLDTLNKAIRVSPKDSMVLCMLGISQLQLGQKDAAVSNFQKAVTASPHDAWAVQLLSQTSPTALPVLPALPVAPAGDKGTSALPSDLSEPVNLTEPTPAVTNALPGAGSDQ